MPEAPVTILGGLPVIAEVWFTRGDGWMTDDDAGVDHLYWQKPDGTKGKEVPQSIYDRLDKKDPYWQCDVTEQASDWLAYKDYEDEHHKTVTLSGPALAPAPSVSPLAEVLPVWPLLP